MANNDESNASNVGGIAVKYTKDEVQGRLTDSELEELNNLVEEFDSFSDDEEDSRYQRWMELDRRAGGG
jgi:hypothetical protein